MATQASHGGTPLEINDISATFIEPITKGIDKSKPPNIATKVCPTVAKPRNAAKTNIDFIFINVKKPGIVNDPIINNPIKTDIPTKTLLVPLINLLMTPIKITNARKIKKETKVLPEKKFSAIKDTNINIKITPRKAIVFHLCSLIFLKKKFSSSSLSCPFSSSLGILVNIFCFNSSLIHLTEKWYHPHSINPVTAIEYATIFIQSAPSNQPSTAVPIPHKTANNKPNPLKKRKADLFILFYLFPLT